MQGKRLKHWWGRRQWLDEEKRQVVENVRRYDWHVVQVIEKPARVKYSFSTGIYDSHGLPELIVVGLDEDLASYVINEVGRRLRDGVEFQEGLRMEDLLPVDICELRTLAPRWRKALYLTNWYYGAQTYPVLQILHGQNQLWQPLMYEDVEFGFAEEAFDRETDIRREAEWWKWPVSPLAMIDTTSEALNQQDHIVYVANRGASSGWQFLNAKGGSGTKACLHEVTEKDLSLEELHDLAEGWEAWRAAPGQEWRRLMAASNEGRG